MGIFIIYIYSQKTLQLYRLQNNFINNFTHELKTPVTSLKLFLQTFTRHELPRCDQLKYIDFMIADVGRLSDNIDRILNLAKIESKTYIEEFVDVDLVDTLETFLKSNEHLFGPSQIRLQRPAAPLPNFRVNQSLFDMLMMNLITNAIKYNRSQQPQIDIRFESARRKLLLHVEDNGIGFDKKEIKKIFRKFYQIGRVDNMTARGSGLGLHLVKTIARIHGWRVTAQSEGSGKGSVFTLSMPAEPLP
jgi:signal transduction histidine kinase